ncbi:MAG: thioredoxin family protein [Chthoniobacterales bacterium]
MKPFRLFCLLTLFTALIAGRASAKPGWLTDLKEAQEQAKTGKKLVLVDFTGSDWCGWCIKLDREVFSKPEFKAYADKNLVLLEVDFPKGKEQTPIERKQNQELAMKYDIEGFPTIVVLDEEGKQVGVLGYTPGGPAAFIAELEKFRKS